MRELRFRAWDDANKKMIYRGLHDRNWYATPKNDKAGCHCVGPVTPRDENNLTLMQYTGLKDKKKDLTGVYEGDILGENGLIKGNIHETPELLKDGTNIVIANMGTDAWRDSEQEAIRRGCEYAQ